MDIERRIFGICGFAGSGKDTVAEYMEMNHGFLTVSFADRLKEIAAELTGDNVYNFYDRDEKEEVYREGFFKGLTRREVLIRFGVCMRKEFGEDIWFRLATDDFDLRRSLELSGAPGYVVPDVRYENEAKGLIRKGGTIIRVVRPGYSNDLPGTTLKDNELDSKWVSIEIVNNGTLDQLEKATELALVASEKDEEGIQTIRASSCT